MNSTLQAASPILKIEGPPGSGKTRELAREACRLIVQDGYGPKQLLVLAATPMGKQRLFSELKAEAHATGANPGLPELWTLDRWLLRVLQEFSPPTDYPVSLLSESDAAILLHEVLRQVILAGHPLYHASRQASASRVFLGLLRQLQLHGLSPAEVRTKGQATAAVDSRLPLVAEIYEHFDQRMRAGNMLCHAQLAHRVLELLDTNPTVLQVLQERHRVILIDEAQELSAVHYRLLSRLGSRLVLAGNQKFSIRSFRGAQPELFETLSELAPSAATYLNKQSCLRGNESILSLLNTFLPQPIWEAQTTDASQLEHMVKFGYFADPQQEAERVAERIQRFVQDTRLTNSPLQAGNEADRPARWQDCAVLLRSSRYKSHLIQAFQHRGIPYVCELLSEETIRLQHGLYDLLKVMNAWQSIGITAKHLQDGANLEALWEAIPGSPQDTWTWTAENNRHLLRGLEMLFLTEEESAELRHLAGQGSPDEMVWLLPVLCNPAMLPPALQLPVASLFECYAQWQASGSVLALVDALFGLVSARYSEEDADSKAALGGFVIFQENLARLDGYYQAGFGVGLPLGEVLANFQALWDGAETTAAEAVDTENVVRILGIHQVQGEEFPLVLIPFLVSGEFPYTRELPELLSPEEQAVLGVSDGYRLEELEEARLLAVAMSRATHQVMLSAHAAEGTELILPSDFYTRLLQSKRRLLGTEELPWICRCSAEGVRNPARCSVDECVASPSRSVATETELPESELFDRYTGESLWAKLDRQEVEPLFDAQEVLNISASAIKTYMQCPRQFYYKHLLRLPQPSSDAAALGTLIHRLMEVFNRQADRIPYTKVSLQTLAEHMFGFEDDLESFYAAGFEDDDLHSLRRIGELGLSQLRQRLMASIDDLADKGYFDRYGSLRRVYAERAVEGLALEGIERVRFRGAMDAIIELADGSVEIVDYKTFRSAYSTGLDTCDKRFLATMEPLPDDEELTHGERFESKLSAAYPTDYQLPLYYLACQQNPDFADKLRAVALQIIRPAFAENPHQGAIRLEIPGTLIEAKKQQMIADINRFIVSPMLESEHFEPNPGRMSCSSCAYYGICELGEDAELQEDGAE